MNILKLLLLTLISFGSLYAQRPYYRPQVHQFDIQLGAGHYLPGEGDMRNLRPWGGSPLNGIRYHYHTDHKNAIRAGFFYRKQHFLYKEPGDVSTPHAWNLLTLEAKAGYERKLNLRKYQIYGGADLIGSMRTYKADTDEIMNSFQYGGGVFFGVRRYFNENFSLAVENELHFLINPDSKNRLSPQEIGVNFLQITMSYHVKRMRKSCACGRPGS